MASNIAVDLARDLIIEAYKKNALSKEVIDQIVDYSTYFAKKSLAIQSQDFQSSDAISDSSSTTKEVSSPNVKSSKPANESDYRESEDESRFEKELIEEAIDAKIDTEGNLGEINSGIADVDTYNLTESHKEMDITEAMIFFQKLESVMVRNKLFCEQDVSRDQVAAAIGTNRTYLIRSIKIATGKTFYEYINDMRTDYAATLLTSTDEPLDVIGTISGFRSKSTYYRIFSARFGCTPTEYRQRRHS